jgi:rare lipoprotein A
MRIQVLPAILLSVVGVASAASNQKAPAASSTGTASFYSGRYEARRNASGQRFSNNAMTAASLDLPLGSRVKVTNLANQRSVILRVNDRGPFVKGRSISVTRRAARELGFIRTGTARVRIEPQ